MTNPMLAALNQSRMNPIKNMMQMMKSAGDPQMMLQQMISQNPQIRQAVQYVNDNGGNAEKAFYRLAKEKGVNPNDILQALK